MYVNKRLLGSRGVLRRGEAFEVTQHDIGALTSWT